MTQQQPDWRISTFNGALLASYFIPTWTLSALRIMVSPVQGLYERPNVAFALFLSDHIQIAPLSMVRMAWLLALAKLTTVAFFAVFLAFTTRRSIRQSGGCDEALGMALGLGSLISFAFMLMASRVHELAAMRMHAAEFLLLLGTAVLMVFERPASSAAAVAPQRVPQAMPATVPVYSSPNS